VEVIFNLISSQKLFKKVNESDAVKHN